MFFGKNHEHGLTHDYFIESYSKLDRSLSNSALYLVFITTAFLWFTRADIDFGDFIFPGWSNIFHLPEYIQDSTVAVFMAFLLIPGSIPESARRNYSRVERCNTAAL